MLSYQLSEEKCQFLSTVWLILVALIAGQGPDLTRWIILWNSCPKSSLRLKAQKVFQQPTGKLFFFFSGECSANFPRETSLLRVQTSNPPCAKLMETTTGRGKTSLCSVGDFLDWLPHLAKLHPLPSSHVPHSCVSTSCRVLLLQLKAYALPPPFQCPLIPLQANWRKLPPGLSMVPGSSSEPAVSKKCFSQTCPAPFIQLCRETEKRIKTTSSCALVFSVCMLWKTDNQTVY